VPTVAFAVVAVPTTLPLPSLKVPQYACLAI